MSQNIFTFLFSVLLLLAGFFIGVLAKIVTPKFASWWAVLSVGHLKKKIDGLKAETEQLKSEASAWRLIANMKAHETKLEKWKTKR